MANGNTLRHLLETRGRGQEGERREGERVRGREGERREGEGRQDGERAGVWNWKGHPHPTPYTLHPSPYTHTLHPTSPAGDERERARGREGERREGERVRGRELMKRTCARHVPRR